MLLFRSAILFLFSISISLGMLALEIPEDDSSRLRKSSPQEGFYPDLEIVMTADAVDGDAFPSEEMVNGDWFGDSDDCPEIDLSAVRSFEAKPISFKEKAEMIFLLCRSKIRDCRGRLLAHFEQHSNEYLIGSACISAIVIAAILKKYTSHDCATTDGK